MEESCYSLFDGSSNSTVPWLDLQTILGEEELFGAGEGAAMSRPVVTLENNHLWKQFYGITNEMTVTRAGRRMFPLLCVKITNLDPHATYALLLEFKTVHSHRWRFVNGEWHPGNATVDPPDQRYVYIHPQSPAAGALWMKEIAAFSKLKLSNKENSTNKIKVSSMHKYQPYIHIINLSSCKGPALHEKKLSVTTHTFPETQFIAVTAYQNDRITQLKIRHNPYAKAFLGSQESHRDEQLLDEPTAVLSHLLPLPPIVDPVTAVHSASRTFAVDMPATFSVPLVPTCACDTLHSLPSYPQTTTLLPTTPVSLSHYSSGNVPPNYWTPAHTCTITTGDCCVSPMAYHN